MQFAEILFGKTRMVLYRRMKPEQVLRFGDLVLFEWQRSVFWGMFLRGVYEEQVLERYSKDSKFFQDALSFSVIKRVNSEDLRKIRTLREKEKEALEIAKEKVLEAGLTIILLGVDYSFDESKIIFHYYNEDKIDFREYVKLLVRVFHKRIEMHQVGIRDRAKSLGGIGICGEEVCCKRFLKNLGKIKVDAIRLQELHTVNITRLTGVCGRLKCCLSYDLEDYVDKMVGVHPIGTKVRSDMGEGVVIKNNIFYENTIVRYTKEDGSVTDIEYSFDEVRKGKLTPVGIEVDEETSKVMEELSELEIDESEEETS